MNCLRSEISPVLSPRERTTKIQKASRIDRKYWDVEKLGNDSNNQNRKEYQQLLKAKL